MTDLSLLRLNAGPPHSSRRSTTDESNGYIFGIATPLTLIYDQIMTEILMNNDKNYYILSAFYQTMLLFEIELKLQLLLSKCISSRIIYFQITFSNYLKLGFFFLTKHKMTFY